MAQERVGGLAGAHRRREWPRVRARARLLATGARERAQGHKCAGTGRVAWPERARAHRKKRYVFICAGQEEADAWIQAVRQRCVPGGDGLEVHAL